MVALRPTSILELRQALLEFPTVQIVGTDGGSQRELQVDARIEMAGMSGPVALQSEDLTCSVSAGTMLESLQGQLSEKNLCVPIAFQKGTVGGAYMAFAGQGGWRDWTIGATFMLADGTVAKSGSHVVKSVAGYDVHRFMAGTRGSLAICLELVLRVFPIGSSAFPPVEIATQEAVTDPTQIQFMKRAKEIFDPSQKLNPGEWGFM